MFKELIISFEIFDEFEGLLADDIEDMEDGPGLGCISPEHSKRRESHVIKVRIARIHILITVNLVFDVHALPGFTRWSWPIGLNFGFIFSNDKCKIE